MKLVYATIPAIWAFYHFTLGLPAWTSVILVLIALLIFEVVRFVTNYPERRRQEIMEARRQIQESLWVGSASELPSYDTKSEP